MAESEATDGIRLRRRFALVGRKYAFLGIRARADKFRNQNVLFNSVLQPLGDMAYIRVPILPQNFHLLFACVQKL